MSTNIAGFYKIQEITLAYKTKFRASERPSVTCMQDACEFFKRIWDDNKPDMVEEGKVMLPNRANRVIGVCHLSTGGITGTVLEIRHVFAATLKANSCQIIVAHNHPSDNLSPSHADRTLTEKLQAAGNNLDIKVLDHLIICRSGFHSLLTDERYAEPVARNGNGLNP